MDPNFVAIALAIFFGLAGIGACVFFGLRGFKGGVVGEIRDTTKDVRSDLSTIREKVVIMQETVKNVWGVVRRSPYLTGAGTVERRLENLGRVVITAEPHLESTDYFLKFEGSVFDADLIIKLSKETGVEEKEKEMFGGELAGINTPVPNRLEVEVPSTDPEVCTKYMSLFLKWLDSEYMKAAPKIEDFEEQIQV